MNDREWLEHHFMIIQHEFAVQRIEFQRLRTLFGLVAFAIGTLIAGVYF